MCILLPLNKDTYTTPLVPFLELICEHGRNNLQLVPLIWIDASWFHYRLNIRYLLTEFMVAGSEMTFLTVYHCSSSFLGFFWGGWTVVVDTWLCYSTSSFCLGCFKVFFLKKKRLSQLTNPAFALCAAVHLFGIDYGLLNGSCNLYIFPHPAIGYLRFHLTIVIVLSSSHS